MKNFPYICCNFCRDCLTSKMATEVVQWSTVRELTKCLLVINMYGAKGLLHRLNFEPLPTPLLSEAFCERLQSNRPFSARGHMVQNPTNWRAKESDMNPLGNVNKEKSQFSSLLTHSFAFQYGIFCTMDPPAAKGQFTYL